MSESKLLGLQSGFRSSCLTTKQIMTLCFLLGTARTQKHSLTIVFVDYGKAFDSVDRRAIPVILRHYGVADVMLLYHDSSAAVSTRFQLTETFNTTSGVLQGDTRLPPIFILLVEYIL